MSRDFRRLHVYEDATELIVAVYEASRQLPRQERYQLISQMQWAAVSVAAKFAEGNARSTRRGFRRFLEISHGSLCELECYLDLCAALGYLDEATLEPLRTLRARATRRLIALLRTQAPTNP